MEPRKYSVAISVFREKDPIEFAGKVENFTYTDYARDNSDDVSVSINNYDYKWLTENALRKEDHLVAVIMHREEGIEEKFPSELSGGMQKRVGFARAIVTNPNIILYDEPTAGLDPVTSTMIEDYIVQLKKELNATCIVVTHQLSTIKRAVDKVIMLYQGDIVFKGSVQELLNGENKYAKQFINASITGPMNIATK